MAIAPKNLNDMKPEVTRRRILLQSAGVAAAAAVTAVSILSNYRSRLKMNWRTTCNDAFFFIRCCDDRLYAFGMAERLYCHDPATGELLKNTAINVAGGASSAIKARFIAERLLIANNAITVSATDICITGLKRGITRSRKLIG